MERSGVRHPVAGGRSADAVAERSGVAGFREMKRVLVTGASGCIGRHVVPALVARGWDVHALTSQARLAEAPQGSAGAKADRSSQVTWHAGNLLRAGDADAIVRAVSPTHLVHLAWYIAPG